MQNREIKDFLNAKSASKIANELVSHLMRFRDSSKFGNVDYSYDLEQGKVSNKNPNTWISFNLDDNTESKDFMKALYSREITDEEHQEIEKFMTAIAVSIPTVYKEELKNAIRDACLKGSDPSVTPLNEIKITYIEFVDYSAISDHQLLKINKEPNSIINTPKILELLQNISEQENMSKIDIANREIKNGNKLFEGVRSIEEAEEYLFDVSMTLFVDYSISDEFMESVKEG